METDVILVDEPMPLVRRITMNRPDKRNSLIHTLRGAILDTLREHDADPDVSVTIIRGAGSSFFIPGNTLYGFRAGPEGCRYLNFRAQADSTYFSKEDIVEARG